MMSLVLCGFEPYSTMIAMPFHPSNTYTINEELNENLMDILDDVEKKAQISLDGKDTIYSEG